MKGAFILMGIVLGVVIAGLGFLDSFENYKNKAAVEINGAVFSVDVAETLAEREKGLSGRPALKENEGMFFIFGEPGVYGFWMKDMKFPIDIVWIRDNKIVGFSENVQPQIGANEAELKIYYPPEPVNKVLETIAGTVEGFNFQVGNKITSPIF